MESPDNYGAAPGDWFLLSAVHDLTEDLLPVVSNPSASISADSKMKGVGKTPSVYNGAHKARGFHDWTSKRASLEDVALWGEQPDYGICIQTRRLRALDIDVTTPEVVDRIIAVVQEELGMLPPMRSRSNAAKCLLAFYVEGEIPKRVARLGPAGIVELLGNGQQFIASGLHPSGVPYQWSDGGTLGMPADFPTISLDKMNALWSHLVKEFAVSSAELAEPSKAKVMEKAVGNDPTAQFLLDDGWVKSTDKSGRMDIRCPFEDGHSSDSGDSATSYWPAHTGGYAKGHFDCKHASCAHRTDSDFIEAIGISIADAFDVFHDEPIPTEVTPHTSAASDFDEGDTPATPEGEKAKPVRFETISADDFEEAPPLAWKVKGVLPSAELAVVYGDSGSGKSFFVFDMLASIARGEEWRGHKVEKGECVYLCAEGAAGMRSRVKAYKQHRDIKGRGQLPIRFITDAPNLTKEEDVVPLVREIRKHGKVSVVVIDTFAQVMAGENENAGESVGKAISHCRKISQHTGAMVILIHHSGKDAASGARGWSGLRAACDMEMCISRDGDMRKAKITKMKDGEEGEEFGFKLHPVCLGLDEDDDMITSCVVEEAEIVRVSKEKAPVLEHRIVAAVVDAVGMTGGVVDSNSVIEKVVEDMLPPAEGKRDTRRDKVVRSLEGLIAGGLIRMSNGKLSIPEGEDTS